MNTLDEMRLAALIRSLHTSKSDMSEERRQALTNLVHTSAEMLTHYAGPQWDLIPTTVQNQALTTVARELETREKSPGGVFAAFGEHDGAIRLARDPMTLVYPLLRPYLQGGFA
ncbi:hypothetical protein K5713_04275 [Trueperella pyogenes]|uniref:hypothetical protein n=1 Tax=Trueperella pyogenes TaxID=1661 RepID=UPI0021681925|nr:hypothetical protein [Trueperella pyogenes]UVJ54505.1 hypothetical protein K5713_04275 [Trueperella pyogenes]